MEKEIIVIAAVSQNGVYGEGGAIPWHIPEDFQHFKDLTTGHTVVMGKNTWESLPLRYRPLPNRYNTVITSKSNYVAQGASVVSTLRQAITESLTQKVFCIGGSRIWYEAMDDIASEAWITIVKREYPVGDETHEAIKLVTPHYYWNGFRFKERIKPKNPEGANPYFEILHWVR